MGIKLKTKDELRGKPLKKSSKKQKSEEVSVSDGIPSQTLADSEMNESQSLPNAQNEENTFLGVKSGKIKLTETEKRRMKDERPATPAKRLRKTIKEKVKLSPQKVPSDEGNAPSRRPSTSSSQEYGSEISVADLENNSDRESRRSYRVNSPKKKRRISPKKRVVRKSKNRSESKSPSRKENKNAESNSQNNEYNNDSTKVRKNTSSRQFELGHNQKESPNKQRRVGNKRSRSPINSTREENDCNEIKLKKSRRQIRKKSPVSSDKNKSPKVDRSNSNNGGRNSRESSVDTRGISPKSREPKQEKHGTLEKKLSTEKSKKLDRSPSHVLKEHHNEEKESLSRGETVKSRGRRKSPRPSSKIPKASNKPKKSLNSQLGPKSREKKTILGKKLSARSKALPKKKTLPSKRKSETGAKTKGKIRKSIKQGIIRRKSVKKELIKRKSVKKRIVSKKSQKSNSRRKK